MGQLLVSLPGIFVASLDIIRARHAVERGGNVNVVRVIVEDCLPVFTRRRERAVGQVNTRPAHVLGCGNLRRKLSVGGAIGAIADAGGVERGIGCALRVGKGNKHEGQAQAE